MAITLLAAIKAALGQTELPHRQNLQLWLRADAGVQRSGYRVTSWGDQSGKGNHARAQADTAPCWVENALGDRPGVQFDGARDFLEVAHGAALNADAGLTVFGVFRFTGGFRMAQKKDQSGGLSGDAWFLSPATGLGVSGRFSHASFTPPNIIALQSSVFDPARRSIRLYLDGDLIETTDDVPTPTPNTDPLHIGKRNNPGGTQGHLHGEIAELIVYNTALPEAERRQVEHYLREKYPITRPDKATLTVTRVLPGHEQVTVDWLRPEAAVAPKDMRYRVDAKLRTAPWDNATSTTVPGDRLSATVTGLLDHADYFVRVVAEEIAAGKPLAVSAQRLVRPAAVPGVVIDYLHKDDAFYMGKGQYIGSPSIARMPNGRLVTSHDLFGVGSDNFSRVFVSEDNGATWRHAADVQPAFWGKLFVHRGKLYLLASKKQYGDLLLHPSLDGGETWGEPAVIAPGPYHKAPMPLTEHNGRLWTCVELQTGGWPAGFQAVAASVPIDADIMDPRNWTVSAPTPCDRAWLPKDLNVPGDRYGLLEGNAVVDPQGNLLDVLRYHIAPHFRKALVLNIAPDGKSLSFNRVIDFYGGMTKFTIRRHPETGVYWSLVNRVTDPKKCGMRNILTLVRSNDLDHWTLVRDILRDDNDTAPQYVGFQYVDWLFDGDDIIVASRTAFNGAHNFHDANHLTFHRVKDFAKGSRMVGP